METTAHSDIRLFGREGRQQGRRVQPRCHFESSRPVDDKIEGDHREQEDGRACVEIGTDPGGFHQIQMAEYAACIDLIAGSYRWQ